MFFRGSLVTLIASFISFQVMASGTIILDGKEVKNRENLHARFVKELHFPTFYGKTLDSLYDVISSDFSGDSVIKIKHVNILKAKLGTEYIDGMIQAIMDAAEDNRRIVLLLE